MHPTSPYYSEPRSVFHSTLFSGPNSSPSCLQCSNRTGSKTFSCRWNLARNGSPSSDVKARARVFESVLVALATSAAGCGVGFEFLRVWVLWRVWCDSRWWTCEVWRLWRLKRLLFSVESVELIPEPNHDDSNCSEVVNRLIQCRSKWIRYCVMVKLGWSGLA